MPAELETQPNPRPGSVKTASGRVVNGMNGSNCNGLATEDAALHIGDRILCVASFDDEAHPAEIVHERSAANGSTSYYVHYLDCDKRLDEWVPADRVREKLARVLSCDAVGSPRFAGAAGGSASDLLQSSNGDLKPYTTRTMKRKFEEFHHVAPCAEELSALEQDFEKRHQQRTKVKNIHVVELGRHELDAWYYAPYPEPYAGCHKLFICEYDLKYFRKKRTLLKHLAGLQCKSPPGTEIYKAGAVGRTGSAASTAAISMFEVDGAEHKLYCQNLCLLSKLFLDHKTLYFDVEPFFFYVLCERDADGAHIVGYFSKEKNSPEGYNLACILTLPCHQRKGYGRFLIEMSYELSKREGKLGHPERPLSDLGAVSYRAYWTQAAFEVLREQRSSSIKDIAAATAIRPEDIISALMPLGLIKYYKGDHLLTVTPKLVEEHLARLPPKSLHVNPRNLNWTPPPAPSGSQLYKSMSLKHVNSNKRML